MTSNPYLTVQALTKYVKRKFDADPHLRNVYVKGELSNVKSHPSGHIYFTLKDDKSRIQSAMFRSNASTLKFKPENGMNVLITGDVSVYESSGNYQLYAQTMEPDGVGALYLAFEQLKRTLGNEGLFDTRWKKELPIYPNTVGVITAQSGAAIQDICTTINRRYPLAKIILFPAVVQGAQAAPSIIRAVEQAQMHREIDVLIVGRGGGSIEDLWAFNEESVARAIFSCTIPTISAVGHETDTTIADFVADRRAPTPTAAAEIAVPARTEIINTLVERKRSLHASFSNKINQETKRLLSLQSAYPLQYPDRLYRPFTEKLIALDDRLQRNRFEITKTRSVELHRLKTLLTSYSPNRKTQDATRTTLMLTERLTRASQQTIQLKNSQFQASLRMLKALDPLNIMERGYSIIYRDGVVANTTDALEVNTDVKIHLQDGIVQATVKEITKIDREES